MSVCLNMILRDEAGIIADTLRNIAAHMDIACWVICDTGSADGTQRVVCETMAALGIPGEIYDAPWVDFAHNRNTALELCRGRADFVLVFDADDRFTGRPGKIPAGDAFEFPMESASRQVGYRRKLLVRNDGRARWRGAVHEYLDTGSMVVAPMPGAFSVISGRFGARSRDPEKYLKDALLLEAAFEAPQDADLRPRHAFYCGNSWRDHGDFTRALGWYETRTGLGGWVEETCLAHLEAALILERQGETTRAIRHLLDGYDVLPDRAECLYHLARIHRGAGRYRSALLFAQAALAIPKPAGNRLFVNAGLYDHAVVFEYLLLTAQVGGNPRILPHYASYLAGPAPDEAKRLIAGLRPGAVPRA